MNKSTIRFLCSNLIKDEILVTALTFWLAFLHSPSTCFSRVCLLSILIPKTFHCTYLKTSRYKYPRDDFFITNRKMNFIWILFHTVISKPQSKVFHRTLNFVNYLQFWTTNHCKWSIIICITYYNNIIIIKTSFNVGSTNIQYG